MQCSQEMQLSPHAMGRRCGLIGEACSTTCQMSLWLTASLSERSMDTLTSWTSATQATTHMTSSYPPKHFWRQIRQNCSSKSGARTSPDCRSCTTQPTKFELTDLIDYEHFEIFVYYVYFKIACALNWFYCEYPHKHFSMLLVLYMYELYVIL